MSLLSLLRHAPGKAARAAVLASSTALMSVALTTLAAAPAAAAVPKTPKFGSSIENLSPYQPQTKCHPTAQPGVLKFRALILRTYAGTGDDGIVRGCKVGGTSEHKEGRAWDWMVSVKNPHQVAQVTALFHWLFAADAYGHKYAMARRMGVMYIIWNGKIWGSYAASAGWRHYSCSGVTGCHRNHVHFSFSKAGASGRTSYWTHTVINVGGTPGNGDSGHRGSGGSGSGSGSGWADGDGDWHPSGPPVLSDSRLPQNVTVPTTDYVVTPYALQAGHHYLVTVDGSYTYATTRTSWDGDRVPLAADAECLQHQEWDDSGIVTPWRSQPSYAGDWSDVLLDLSVDGSTDWTPTVDDGNGCNTTDHRYVLHLTPTRTAPLSLHVVGGDRVYGSGTLTVTVARDGS
jgi:hypothetical protein